MYIRSDIMRFVWIIWPFFFILCQAEIIDNPLASYDYIIVGGGTSGNVLANRLSANKNISVVILEAGYKPPRIADIPLMFYRMQLSNVDWQYKTMPQKHACKQLKEKRSMWARGKVLGGTSVINALLYSRGTKKDYDKWESDGSKGWSWDEVLPYFMKSERNMDEDIMYNGFHGRKGEVPVQRPKYFTPLAQAYMEAVKQLNYSEGDFNGPHSNKFMPVQVMVNKGKRVSTYDAFIKPIIERKNLHILLGAFATKIIFNDQKRASGIQFDHQNQSKMIIARKEIILSSGAVNSPQLLMLSGIGPKEHLEELEIPVISDVPVGKNLQDHVFVGIPFVVKPKVSLHMVTVIQQLLRSNKENSPFTSVGMEVIGFLNSMYNDEPEWPDLELMFSSCSPSSDREYLGSNIQGMTDELWEQVFKPYVDKDTYFCMPVLTHPLSKGEIKLVSSNPYDYPFIDPKYLSVSQDIKILIEGVKKCYDIAKTPAMQMFGASPFNVTFPGCEEYNKSSDEYFACVIQTYTLTAYHPAGTCKMGSKYDCTTVVDSQLRVKGVTNLRVADTSIMPTLNTGHTAAPAMMIAEKAADMILSDYRHSEKIQK